MPCSAKHSCTITILAASTAFKESILFSIHWNVVHSMTASNYEPNRGITGWGGKGKVGINSQNFWTLVGTFKNILSVFGDKTIYMFVWPLTHSAARFKLWSRELSLDKEFSCCFNSIWSNITEIKQHYHNLPPLARGS